MDGSLEPGGRIRPLQCIQCRGEMESIFKIKGKRKPAKMRRIASLRRRRVGWLLSILAGAIVLFISSAGICSEAAAEKKPKPAKFKVSGYGTLGNFQLRRILRTLELSGKQFQYFGPAFVEDSALLLTSRIQKDGYL